MLAMKTMPIAESPEVALSAYGVRGDLRKVVGGIALGVHQIGDGELQLLRAEPARFVLGDEAVARAV